jgi:lambda family phage portal protein
LKPAPRNFIDKVIGYFDPAAGARRAHARLVSDRLTGIRKYEGASKGRRTAGWVTSGASANAELQGSLAVLRNRSRDLVRNGGYGGRAISLIETNVVGCGIVPQAQHKTSSREDAAQSLWKEWGESTLCDYQEETHFYGLQAQIVRAMAESGEVLIRRIWMRPSDNLPVPMQLQVLEADYINTLRSNEKTADGGYIVQGKEFDKRGKLVAYWLFDRHPGEIGVPFSNLVAKRVLATDIIHLYRADRPGQIRGIPFLAPCIIRLRDLDEYEDAQLQRQKIASCFSVIIRDAEAALDNRVAGTGAEASEDQLEKIGPGMILELPDGKDVSFATPPGVDGYSEYTRSHLRGIAVGTNLTYEAFTGDYSNVNFSSGRMGWLEMNRSIQQLQYNLVIPRLCVRIWSWFQEAAELEGRTDAVGVLADWMPPRREQIDPKSENAATQMAIRNGTKTWEQAVREEGYDPKKQIEEIKRTNKAFDDAGIILDCDPRNVTAQGLAQVEPADPADSNADATDKPAPAKNKDAQGGRK